ncbi:MAG TPA: M23 family metallopeptidase [Thermomonas sp.]|nr:M23 family metallopeptidase [Thermomonas sp.]
MPPSHAARRTGRRRLVPGLWFLLVVAIAFGWWWRSSPLPRALPELYRLSRMPPASEVLTPVDGVRVRAIADTWGGVRDGGRRHQGTDIFAKRGTAVLSATDGVVVRIGDYGIGGRHAWVLGPGGERHYYAHLEDWAPGLHTWQRLRRGDAIGRVGNTGNARTTPPHLHYGIYDASGALNPHPRLRDAKPAH